MRQKSQRLVTVFALTVLVAVSGCAQTAEDSDLPESDSPSPTTSSYTTVASNLEAPWSMAFYGDWTFVSERDNGTISYLGTDGELQSLVRLDDIDHGGEGGLLGLAVGATPYLYAYSTGPNGNRVQRFRINEIGPTNADGLQLGSPELIFDNIPAAGVHNGGRLEFGPDGMLYVSTGDAAERDKPQDLSSLAGKILRMTPTGGIPEGNPFPDSYVWSYGHRNIQGMAWDSKNRMFASEFGAGTWDELNLIEPGNNYGWPHVEGIAERSDFTDPLIQWQPAEASPSGIAIKDDVVFLANLRGQRLTTVAINPLLSTGEEKVSEYLVGEYGRLRDVKVHQNGNLLVMTNNTDGRGSPEADDDIIIELPSSLFHD